MKTLHAFQILLVFLAVISSHSNLFSQWTDLNNKNIRSTNIRATGFGAPNLDLPPAAQRASAIEAAKLDALRNALEAITAIRILETDEGVITSSCRGSIRNFKIVNIRYVSDFSVEVEIEVPSAGILSEDEYSPFDFTISETHFRGQTDNAMKSVEELFTGLVIDARGLDIRPTLVPKILNERGNEVYHAGILSRNIVMAMGVAGYINNMDQAKKHTRVGSNPLMIKALKAHGPNQTNMTISNVDA